MPDSSHPLARSPAAAPVSLRPLDRAVARGGGRGGGGRGAAAGAPWLVAGLSCGRTLLRLGRPLLPGGAAAWGDLEARLAAFSEFQEGRLIAADGGAADLGAAVRRAAAAGPYRGLWRTEGVGYAWGERLARAGPPGRPAFDPTGVAAGAWLPLHSGLGLALAAEEIAGAARTVASRPGSMRRVVDTLWDRAQELALPGLSAAVFEGLGLALRAIRPSLLDDVARALPADGDDRSDLFWHGVGRALVFVPSAALATAPDGGALAEALAVPEGPSRDNAVAGLAWAAALVDVERPRALRRRFRAAAERLAEIEPYAHGVVSALLLWSLWSGDAAPAPDREPEVDAWRRWVAAPLAAALRGWTNDADTLFRYRPLADLGWREEAAA